MKKILLVTLSVAAITLYSCAKKTSETKTVKTTTTSTEEQESAALTPAEQQTIQDQLKAAETGTATTHGKTETTKPYAGKNLILLRPHDTNWGELRLLGNDAKALYDQLRVKEELDDTKLKYSRKTKHALCYKQLVQANEDNDNTNVYTCHLYLSYRTGAILETESAHKRRVIIKRVKKAYVGDALTLQPGRKRVGIIHLKDSDAKELYNELSVKAVEKRKTGMNVVCSESDCEFRFNYRSGKPFQTNDLAAASESSSPQAENTAGELEEETADEE